MSAIADLHAAGELLEAAFENLILAATSSRVRLLPGVDSDAEWRRRLAAIDVRLARFYLGLAEDQLAAQRHGYHRLADELREAIHHGSVH